MHPQWQEINALLAALPLRRVLLSNGLLLERALANLNCDEVQISLDGLAAGHERLRGQGSFAKAVKAARAVKESGRDLSIATMAHASNLDEMDGPGGVGARAGGRRVGASTPPALTGRLGQHPELAVSPEQAAQAMARAYGGAFHGGGGGMACGLHLATVAADGKMAQCGFYLDQPLGRAEEGLWTCWARRKAVSMNDLNGCRYCEAADDCGGGCRFRAPGPLEPDPVMCAAFGIEPKEEA